MINKFRNEVINLLYNYVKRPVIMLNQISNKPLIKDTNKIDYPFLGYKIISCVKENERGISEEILVDSKDKNYTKDILQKLHLQMQINLSFTAYSDDENSSNDLIKKVYDYFKYIGYFELISKDIVVVDLKNIQNRAIFEVDFYERAVGFDARFRITDTIQRKIETIETYKINKI